MMQLRSKNLRWRRLATVVLLTAGCHFPDHYPVLKTTKCTCSPHGACGGFTPTCWRQWPGECAMCPPAIEPEEPFSDALPPGSVETVPTPVPVPSKTSKAPLGSPTGSPTSYPRSGRGATVRFPQKKSAQVNFHPAVLVGQIELAPMPGTMKLQPVAVPAEARLPKPEPKSVARQTPHAEQSRAATESQVLLRGDEPSKHSKWKTWSIPKVLQRK